MNYKQEAFIHDNVEPQVPVDLRGTTRSTSDIADNLSEDMVITSLDAAKELFADKDLATINEKRSLLEALWLYVGDENVVEDSVTQDVKTDIVLELANKIAHGLSDEDVKDAFPSVYKILFPESE